MIVDLESELPLSSLYLGSNHMICKGYFHVHFILHNTKELDLDLSSLALLSSSAVLFGDLN
jgi:hypothetical protein